MLKISDETMLALNNFAQTLTLSPNPCSVFLYQQSPRDGSDINANDSECRNAGIAKGQLRLVITRSQFANVALARPRLEI